MCGILLKQPQIFPIPVCVPLFDVALQILPCRGGLYFAVCHFWAGFVTQRPDPSEGLKTQALELAFSLYSDPRGHHEGKPELACWMMRDTPQCRLTLSQLQDMREAILAHPCPAEPPAGRRWCELSRGQRSSPGKKTYPASPQKSQKVYPFVVLSHSVLGRFGLQRKLTARGPIPSHQE